MRRGPFESPQEAVTDRSRPPRSPEPACRGMVWSPEPASERPLDNPLNIRIKVSHSVNVIETERLSLRLISTDDSAFILKLLNDPAFLQFIGDKGVRTLDDARRYILDGPIASYERWGFGLYMVELKGSQSPAGICGLIKRDSLPDVDIGFAILPQYRSMGYAFESAAAVMEHGKTILSLERIVGVTTSDNSGSIRVLEKLGLRLERMVQLSPAEPEIRLYAPAT